MTEELMLHGCLNNTASAQEVLYNRFSPRMLGVCYRFARNREDAEDASAEKGRIVVKNDFSCGHSKPRQHGHP